MIMKRESEKQAESNNSKEQSMDVSKGQSASPLELLLEKSKKNKVLTQSDIIQVLPDGGVDLEAADALIAKLVEHGIEVQDDEDSDEPGAAEGIISRSHFLPADTPVDPVADGHIATHAQFMGWTGYQDQGFFCAFEIT